MRLDILRCIGVVVFEQDLIVVEPGLCDGGFGVQSFGVVVGDAVEERDAGHFL